MHKKHKWKYRRLFIDIGVFIVTALVVTLAVIPIFQRREGVFDAQQFLVDDLDKNRQDFGEEPLNGSAYNYWYAPENSFGINQTKFLNFSFWKKWLKKYFWYNLEARPDNQSGWQDANEFLNVTLMFNEINHTCKITLILNTSNAPKALFYRFTLVANRSVISHINKSVQYQYILNLSANQTENYSICYNYSDLVPYIENGIINIKQGIYNNYFYQRIKTNKKIDVNKTFVIDPVFGYEDETSGDGRIDCVERKIGGTNFTFSGTTGSTAENISAYVRADDATESWRFALYFESNGTFIDETNFVNFTSSFGQSYTLTGWFTNGSEPTLTNGVQYWLMCWAALGDSNQQLYYTNDASYDVRHEFIGSDPGSFADHDPVTPTVLSQADAKGHVWCSYTEPGLTWQVIDDSINGSLYNQTSWQVIDDTINGSLYNVTTWQVIDDTINGSLYNQTQWQIIDDTINGSLYNTSIWQVIDDTINGSLYNQTQWQVLDDTINGSLYNQTSWQVIDDTINGTLWNESWTVIDDTINGSLYNVTPPSPFNITDEYPENQSYIYDLQPTVFFTLTHPSGNLMNYSVYTGNSSANATHFLDSGANVSNGTYAANEYHNATEYYEEYYWRIVADDGNSYVNETLYFQLSEDDEVIPSTPGFGIMLFMIALVTSALIFNKRKRR